MKASFEHDGDGQRRTAPNRQFVWDGRKVLQEKDSAANTVAQYTLSNRRYGNLVSQRRSGVSSFYHFDGLGSTDRLTDANQAVTDSYTYLAFGEEKASSGSTPNPFRYIGKLGYYREGVDNLLFLRARYYQPEVGRFLTVDPAREDMNGYGYVGNSPVYRVDPSGLQISLPNIGGVVIDLPLPNIQLPLPDLQGLHPPAHDISDLPWIGSITVPTPPPMPPWYQHCMNLSAQLSQIAAGLPPGMSQGTWCQQLNNTLYQFLHDCQGVTYPAMPQPGRPPWPIAPPYYPGWGWIPGYGAWWYYCHSHPMPQPGPGYGPGPGWGYPGIPGPGMGPGGPGMGPGMPGGGTPMPQTPGWAQWAGQYVLVPVGYAMPWSEFTGIVDPNLGAGLVGACAWAREIEELCKENPDAQLCDYLEEIRRRCGNFVNQQDRPPR